MQLHVSSAAVLIGHQVVANSVKMGSMLNIHHPHNLLREIDRKNFRFSAQITDLHIFFCINPLSPNALQQEMDSP